MNAFDASHRKPTNKPREKVSLDLTTVRDGPRVTGKLVLGKTAEGGTTVQTAEGWFSKGKLGK